MMFHAKALELLSQCYPNVEEMNHHDDLEVVYYFHFISFSVNFLPRVLWQRQF